MVSLYLKDSIKVTLDISSNGDTYLLNNLSKKELLDGSGTIIKSLQSFMFASTEAAKEPLQALLGVNLSTANFDILMSLMGLNKTFVGAFLLQPNLKKLLEKAARENKNPKDVVSEQISVLTDIPLSKLIEKPKTLVESELYNSSVKELDLLVNYIILNNIANDFSSMVSASKVDAGLGANTFAILENIIKGRKILNKVDKDSFMIPNAANIVPAIGYRKDQETGNLEFYIENENLLQIPQLKAFSKIHVAKLNQMSKHFSQFDNSFIDFLELYEQENIPYYQNMTEKKAEILFSAVQTLKTQAFIKDYESKKNQEKILNRENLDYVIDLIRDSDKSVKKFILTRLKNVYDSYNFSYKRPENQKEYYGDGFYKKLKDLQKFTVEEFGPKNKNFAKELINSAQELEAVYEFFRLNEKYKALSKILRYNSYKDTMSQVSDTKSDESLMRRAQEEFLEILEDGEYPTVAEFLFRELIKTHGWAFSRESFMRLLPTDFFNTNALGRQVVEELREAGNVEKIYEQNPLMNTESLQDVIHNNNPNLLRTFPEKDIVEKMVVNEIPIKLRVSPSSVIVQTNSQLGDSHENYIKYTYEKETTSMRYGYPEKMIENETLVYKRDITKTINGEEFIIYTAMKPLTKVDYVSPVEFFRKPERVPERIEQEPTSEEIKESDTSTQDGNLFDLNEDVSDSETDCN